MVSCANFDDIAGRQDAHFVGKELPYRACVMYLKGDWAEFSKTFSLSPWSSVHAPCPMCDIPLEAVSDIFPGFMNNTDVGWRMRTALDYTAACARSEINVNVHSEPVRAAILEHVTHMQSYVRKQPGGMVVTSKVPGTQLEVGDVLTNSKMLPDLSKFKDRPVPFEAVFWRSTRAHNNAIVSWVHRRCPLFNDALHTSPSDSLAFDEMHTINLGIMMRWVSAVLWRVVEINPWRSVSQELAASRLESDMFLWFSEAGIHHDKRLGALNLKMMGINCKLRRCPGAPHPGCPMSSKAAETATLFRFSMHMLRRHIAAVPLGAELLAAGEALEAWRHLARTVCSSPKCHQLRPPSPPCQRPPRAPPDSGAFQAPLRRATVAPTTSLPPPPPNGRAARRPRGGIRLRGSSLQPVPQMFCHSPDAAKTRRRYVPEICRFVRQARDLCSQGGRPHRAEAPLVLPPHAEELFALSSLAARSVRDIPKVTCNCRCSLWGQRVTVVQSCHQ